MELNECINFLLTTTQCSVVNYFKSKLSPLGLTPVQYAVLKCLWDNGDQSPTQIAQALVLDTSTVTGILDRMEKKDLVERVPSAKDRRALTIHIRPLGRSLRPQIEAVILETNLEVLSGLDTAHFIQLKEDLSKIMSNVDALKAQAQASAS